MNEVWENIIDFEGLYKVSNRGRIKSVKRIIYTKNGIKRLVKGKILSQYVNSRGYLQIGLVKNKKSNSKKVARLVLIAFVPNPENKPQVNHIDCNKLNNHISNLEWVTAKENIQHAWKNGLSKSNNTSKKVLMLSLTNKPLLWFYSIKEIGNIMLLDKSSISKCCKNKIKTVGGYKWQYY